MKKIELFDKICYIEEQTYALKKEKCDKCNGKGWITLKKERYGDLKVVCDKCHGEGIACIEMKGYAVIEDCYIINTINSNNKLYFTVARKTFLDALINNMKYVYNKSDNLKMKIEYEQCSKQCIKKYFNEVFYDDYIKSLCKLSTKYGYTKVNNENVFLDKYSALKTLSSMSKVIIGYKYD